MKIFLKTSIFAVLPLVISLANGAAAPARADEITVSAAASLRDVMGALGADFTRQNPKNKPQIHFNFGSSGALQKQIEAGAPVDLFIAAADKNVTALAASGDIDAATRRVLARGELVLIAPRASKLRSFGDLRGPNVRTIALGATGVPAGDYARQTLKFLGLGAVLQPKIVSAKDVRAVLRLVVSGDADAGLVYRTDALTSSAVRIVAIAPPQSHQAIVYPLALVKSAPNRGGALQFWRFLQSAKAKATLKRFGFGV